MIVGPSHMLIDMSSTLKHLHSKPKEFEAPFLTDFIETRGKDTFRQQAAKRMGQSDTEFLYNKNCVIVQRAPIDEELQELVPQSMR